MAKVTNVNIDLSVNGGAQAFFDLKTLLVGSCGYTLAASGDGGTNFTNGAVPDRVSTFAAFNVANAYYVLADPSGKLWLGIQRGANANTFAIRVYAAAPTATAGNALPNAANTANQWDASTGLSTSGANRGHLISYNSAENTAGIRPIYVLFTASSPTITSALIIEAAADGTYSTNAWPWVATANQAGLNPSSNIQWRYYYSPSTLFAPLTAPSGFNNSGVDAFTSQDGGLPVSMGRAFNAVQPGFFGFFKNIRWRTAQRGYPDTMTTVGGDRFVYINDMVVPYADGVNPV